MHRDSRGWLENPITVLMVLAAVCIGMYVAVSAFGSLSYTIIPRQTASGWEGGMGGSEEMNQSMAGAENAAITVFSLGSIAPMIIIGFGIIAVIGAVWGLKR